MPGPAVVTDGVEMKFRYVDYFKTEPKTGYETLLYDCMIGDNILFQRADSVEAGWQAVQPFLDAWREAGARGLVHYQAGSDGPEEADDLLARDGRQWRKSCLMAGSARELLIVDDAEALAREAANRVIVCITRARGGRSA